MTSLLQDLRYALRTLRRSPGFASVAIATLALGIGANTAIFSVVDAVILRPLPFPRSRELVRVTSDLERQDRKDTGLSALELFDYRASGMFSAISGIWAINSNITGLDRPERAEVVLADTNYFDILGARAEAGRLFIREDYRPGISEVAVISDAWWHRHYGADPSAVGKTFRLDDDIYTIIGVAPPGFRHPGRTVETDVDIWAPAGWTASPFNQVTRRTYILTGALARLAPGWTPAAAERRLDEIASHWRKVYAADYPSAEGWRPRVVSLQDDLLGNVRPALVVLLCAVGFVLLIACANVANLLLARASARRREIAIRQALGASRARIVRQALTESLLLSVFGGAFGIALAALGVDALLRLSPDAIARHTTVALDPRVLAFAVAAALLTGVLFGLAPALQSAGPAVQEDLRDGSRGIAGGRGGRLRSALVVFEFAVSLVLLVAAALLIRTLIGLERVNPGFDSRDLDTASLWLPQPNLVETGRYYEHGARAALFHKILNRLDAMPGVTAAVATTRAPFGAIRNSAGFDVEGRAEDRGGVGSGDIANVSPRYFRSMAIPVVAGRDFVEQDDEKSEPVAIVSQSLAQRYFPGEDPVGRRLRVRARRGPPPPWMRIVGVVRDVKMEALDTGDRPALYRPLWQNSGMSVTLVLRGPSVAGGLSARIEDAVRSVDAELPIYAVRSMDQAMAATMAQRRFAMRLLAAFAAAALALSAIGIYGVVAYAVGQRTHEIGIRMALGARPRDVVAMVLREGLTLTLLGVAFGVAGAVALTRAMSALLFGISPRDPVTLSAIAGLLIAVALLASFLPARRAARVDPMIALRGQ